MPPSRIRFVTLCQQLLALGVVLAVLTPATSVISLDVVHDRQAQPGVVPADEASGLAADLSAYTRVARGEVVTAGNLNGDGHDDLLVRGRGGALYLVPGTATGYGEPRALTRDVCCSTLKGSGPWRAPRHTSR